MAEFGEDFYGKAWDYTYKGEKEDIMDFLSCEVSIQVIIPDLTVS